MFFAAVRKGDWVARRILINCKSPRQVGQVLESFVVNDAEDTLFE